MLSKRIRPSAWIKAGDVPGAHLLGTGAVSQVKTFGATVGAIGTFRYMNDQQLVFCEFFNANGHGRITSGGHDLDLGQGFIGKIGAHNLIAVTHPDEDAAARGVGQSHKFLGQVGVDVGLELQVGTLLPLRASGIVLYRWSCGISCGQLLRKLKDFIDFRRPENAANPLGMNDRKG